MCYEYRKVIFPYYNNDGSISWVVEFPDLPGCSATGNSEDEALSESKIACELWLDAYHDSHGCYPESKEVKNDYSGRFVLRLPKSLHKNLAQTAEREGVSLNFFVVTLLSQKYGEKIARPTYYNVSEMPEEFNSKDLKE